MELLTSRDGDLFWAVLEAGDRTDRAAGCGYGIYPFREDAAAVAREWRGRGLDVDVVAVRARVAELDQETAGLVGDPVTRAERPTDLTE